MLILNQLFFNYNIFSALEQFDVIRFLNVCSGFGISNITVASLLSLIFLVIFFYSVPDVFYFSTTRSIKLNLFFFARKLISENLLMYRSIFSKFIFFIFFYILISNLAGLIPYSMTTTSFLVLTLFLSATCFVGLNIVGLKIHGFKFFSLFVPDGTPFPLIPFLIVIEFISYAARVASLSIRLFANMMAGHTLLKILSGFLWDIATSLLPWSIYAFALFLIILVVSVLELLIAFLQSAVYLILISIYMNDVVRLH